MSSTLNLTIDFAGGTENLFNKKKSQTVQLDGSKVVNIRDLIFWMRDSLLTEREEMFMQNDTVRPGILVLVNDTDWEILGELEYKLQDNDNVLFISTLHGG